MVTSAAPAVLLSVGLAAAAVAVVMPSRARSRRLMVAAGRRGGRDRPHAGSRLGRAGLRPGRGGAARLAADDVAALADRVAALATAGLPPQRAWAAIERHPPSVPSRELAAAVVAGQRQGLSAADAVRQHVLRVAGRTGADRSAGAAAALHLAVALDLADRSGTGLVETLSRFAAALRADRRASAERAAALAGPQATAVVLSFLPLAGLLLGVMVGARPWHALLATGVGRVCLLAGVLLWALGRAWSRALVRRAEGSG